MATPSFSHADACRHLADQTTNIEDRRAWLLLASDWLLLLEELKARPAA
jgi:hypothetical protein